MASSATTAFPYKADAATQVELQSKQLSFRRQSARPFFLCPDLAEIADLYGSVERFSGDSGLFTVISKHLFVSVAQAVRVFGGGLQEYLVRFRQRGQLLANMATPHSEQIAWAEDDIKFNPVTFPRKRDGGVPCPPQCFLPHSVHEQVAPLSAEGLLQFWSRRCDNFMQWQRRNFIEKEANEEELDEHSERLDLIVGLTLHVYSVASRAMPDALRTAARTGGLCMACKQGIRQQIEAARAAYQQQRQPDPFMDHWTALVHRVHDVPDGLYRLSRPERIYCLVSVLQGEVLNGGIGQFFDNSSGDFYQETMDALEDLGAMRCRALLLAAKQVLFPHADPPRDRTTRYNVMPQYPDAPDGPRPDWDLQLERINVEFYTDPDQLSERLRTYAIDHQLVRM